MEQPPIGFESSSILLVPSQESCIHSLGQQNSSSKLTSELKHDFSLEVGLAVEGPAAADDLVGRGPQWELEHREFRNVVVQREPVVG